MEGCSLSENWPAIATQVAAAINSVGFEVLFTRPTYDVNVANPWEVGTRTSPAFTLKCLVSKNIHKRSNDTVIRDVELTLLVEVSSLGTPQLADFTVNEGKQLHVSRVETIKPGNVALYHRVEFTR